MAPTPGVRVFVGELNPAASVETPFFRFAAREAPKAPATSPRLTFHLQGLETAAQRADANVVIESDVYYRLEIFDPRSDGAKYFQSRFHYSRTIIAPSVDAVMTHPVTQIVSGGAGAPFYSQNAKAPWARAVKKFAMVNHYVLFTVDGPRFSLSAIAVDGNEIDRATINPGK